MGDFFKSTAAAMTTARNAEQIVFISYRRADTDALAGRLRDRMVAGLSGWNVFMDVASVEPGANFKEVIDTTLSHTSIMLVLIGKNWLSNNRLHDPEDLVRYEITSALALDLRIIPVLVSGATMPSVHDLPSDLVGLTLRNAIEVRHTRFDDDLAHLVRAISGEAVSTRAERPSFLPLLWSTIAGTLIGVVAVIVGLIVHFEITGGR